MLIGLDLRQATHQANLLHLQRARFLQDQGYFLPLDKSQLYQLEVNRGLLQHIVRTRFLRFPFIFNKIQNGTTYNTSRYISFSLC